MTTESLPSPTTADAPGGLSGPGGRVLFLIVLLLGISIYLNAFTGPVGPPPGFGSDFSAALAEAKASGKPVVVAFYADG